MTEEYFYCGVLNQLQSAHRRVLFCKIHCEIKHNSLREYAVVIFSYFL